MDYEAYYSQEWNAEIVLKMYNRNFSI